MTGIAWFGLCVNLVAALWHFHWGCRSARIARRLKGFEMDLAPAAQIKSLEEMCDSLWDLARRYGAPLPPVPPMQMAQMVAETAVMTDEQPENVFRRLMAEGDEG
jgi:hypothetical protein